MPQQAFDLKGIHIAKNYYLYPLDEFNWVLCKPYASGKYEGKLRPLGQFFNRNTIDLAVSTVADLIEKSGEDVTELREYAERIKREREEFFAEATKQLKAMQE